MLARAPAFCFPLDAKPAASALLLLGVGCISAWTNVHCGLHKGCFFMHNLSLEKRRKKCSPDSLGIIFFFQVASDLE